MTQRDPFFTLEDPYEEVADATVFLRQLRPQSKLCECILYRPSELTSPYSPRRCRINGVTYRNVSFSKTTISQFEFNNCSFYNCLLIDTAFKDCRFTACKFVNCNTFRIEFEACYVDPRSFKDCIPDKRKYPNIGVYLFQALLRNSRQQAQPDFADEAQYRFKKWQRFKMELDARRAAKIGSRLILWSCCAGLLAFDLATGSGMRLRRLIGSSTVLLFSISWLNWHFAETFGLKQGDHVIRSFDQAFYFSTVITTTLGFGDIAPTTVSGRLAISCEAIIGFTLFALLTSTMYRRFSS